MEEKFNKSREAIVEKFDLPSEIILDIPKVIVTGDREITIENHKGIVTFDKEVIKVNSRIGIVKIEGINFEVLYIGGSTIVISGKFKSIVYEDKKL